MIKKIVQYCNDSFWNLGFIEESLETILNSKELNVRWVKHYYTDRWFADPYILSANEKEIVALVEEFSYSIHKGRLAKLTIRRSDYQLIDMKIILELPSHLSFPTIIRRNKEVYVMPENFQGGGLKIYRYNDNDDTLTYVTEVSTLPLTDSILYKGDDGNQYILSTYIPTQNGNTLSVFKYYEESMTIDSVACQEIEFDSNIARNAGDIFSCNNIMYRPAQDCNKGYGNGIWIQQLDYSDLLFNFKNIIRFFPKEKKYSMGFHTFNHYNGITVVDAHGYRRPFLHAIIKLARNLKKTITSL